MDVFKLKIALEGTVLVRAETANEAMQIVHSLLLDTDLDLAPTAAVTVTGVVVSGGYDVVEYDSADDEAAAPPPRWTVGDELLTKSGQRVIVTSVGVKGYTVRYWRTTRYSNGSFRLSRAALDEHGKPWA